MELIERILRRAVMAALVGVPLCALAYPDIIADTPVICPIDTRDVKVLYAHDQLLPIAVSGNTFTTNAPGTATVMADQGITLETVCSGVASPLTTVVWNPPHSGFWKLTHTVGDETLIACISLTRAMFPGEVDGSYSESAPVNCPLDTRACRVVTSLDQVLPVAVSGYNFTTNTPGTATVVADQGAVEMTLCTDEASVLTQIDWSPTRSGIWSFTHTVGGETQTGSVCISTTAFPDEFGFSNARSQPSITPIDTRPGKTYRLSDPIPPIAISSTSFGEVAAGAATVVGTMNATVSTPASGETSDLTNVVWQAPEDGIWTFTHTVGGETLTGHLTFFPEEIPQQELHPVTVPIDTRSGTREITSLDQLLPITYSGSDWSGASGTATVSLSRENRGSSTFVAATSATADQVWSPTVGGDYTFEHTSTADGAVTRSASFHLASAIFVPAGIGDILAPDEGYVVNRDDVWTVVVTNDLTRTVQIPDNMGPVVIDLNGHSVTAPNGTAGVADGKGGVGIVIYHDEDPDLGPTELAIIDSSGNGVTIRGGDGADGNPSGAGGAAIEVADDANAGVTLDVGEQVSVIGGNGGKGVGTDAGGAGVAGGAGGVGVNAGPGTLVNNDGAITGGNGGDGTDGTTGLGGKGGLGGSAILGNDADPEGTGTETRGSDGQDGVDKETYSVTVLCPIDTRDGTRVVASLDELLPVTYSGANWGGASGAATVTISVDGGAAATFVNASAETSTEVWTPVEGGLHAFTHTSTAAGATVLNASFFIPYTFFVPEYLQDILDEDEGYVDKINGLWTLILTNNVVGPLVIPDNVGPVAVDLNGYSIVSTNGVNGTAVTPGTDGGAGILVVKGEGAGGGVTALTLTNSTSTASVVQGGDGGDGHPAGNGGAGIRVADDADSGVTITVEENVDVRGGSAGDGLGVDGRGNGTNGGAGGAGVDAGPGTLVGNDGAITGGTGGDASDGTNGRGGQGGAGGAAVDGAEKSPAGSGTETDGTGGAGGADFTTMPEGLADILDVDEGYVDNIDGTWTVVVTNDLTGPVEIPDNLGPIAFDLNGHTITSTNGVAGSAATEGGNGGAGILVFNADGEGAGATGLVVTNSSVTASTIRGGNGGDGHPAGTGGAAIKVADDVRTGVTVAVEENLSLIGGNGGAGLGPLDQGDGTPGGDGGAGVDAGGGTIIANDGTITGGNGGKGQNGSEGPAVESGKGGAGGAGGTAGAAIVGALADPAGDGTEVAGVAGEDGKDGVDAETFSVTVLCPIDTREDRPRRPEALAEILPFAYDVAWTNGVTVAVETNGESAVELPMIRLVEMNAQGTPALVANWTETTAITNIACADYEGLVNWVSDRRAYFRAELIVGSNTNETAYFDFGDCTDLKKTLSCFTPEQQEFQLVYHPNGDPQFAVTGPLTDFEGNLLVEGVDYTLVYPTNALDVGVATPVTVNAAGSAWGGTVTLMLTFAEAVAGSASKANVPLDTRKLTVRVVTNAIDDLLDFAYNNTTNWVKNGDAMADGATIRLVEMDAHGTPSLVTNWTDTTCFDDYAQDSAEGTTRWVSDRKAYFRAELMIDGVVHETAYLDFGECVDSPKTTLSLFTANQMTMVLVRDPVKGWVVTGTVVDTNGVELVAGVDYEYLYSELDLENVTVQSKGTTWGGRVIVRAHFSGVTISSDASEAAFDTRTYRPRRPEAVDEILPFAYDVAWTNGATAISPVSITAYAYGELDEGRREAVAVTNTVGTGIWEPAFKGLYQARIVSELPEGAAVTNTVEIDLGPLEGLLDYVAAQVVLPDGTVTNCITLKEALEVARTQTGACVTLKNDRNENLVLEEGDDIVFDGGAFTLDGGFDVPDGADLAVIGGTFTTNPASPKDYVPRGCVSSVSTDEPPTWSVACDWLIGAPTAGDMKAFLTDDGTLKVVGAGDMQFWASSLEPPKLPPWEAYDEAITNVAVGPLVSSVGSEAFSNCVNLVNVTLPGTIQEIGRDAFDSVNTNGTDTVTNGAVAVTYVPAKAGVVTPFTVEEMRVVGGKLTRGIYDYDPTAEIDPSCVAAQREDGRWVIDEAWAEVGGQKYIWFETAFDAAGEGDVVKMLRGTGSSGADSLQRALDRGAVLDGPGMLEVRGSLTNGIVRCPIHVIGEITGGDFYGPVSTPDGAISGGTFSERPADNQLKDGYTIVETSDVPPRYRVVKMPENGVNVPRAVEGGLVYNGTNQVGVVGTEGIVYSGPTNATESGVYTVTVKPEDGKTWPDGTTDEKTITWAIVPAIDLPDGAKVEYDPEIGEEPDTGGWKIVLEKDVSGPIVIPDSFGEDVGGRVVLDLGGHTIESPKAVQPGETNGVPAIVIIHTPGYTEPALDLEIKGPGGLTGGDGADGVLAHPAGGAGGLPIGIEDGAVIVSGCPSVSSDVTETPGDEGSDYVPGEDEPTGLLMTVIDSRDEYLAIAIPYANTNDATGVTAPTLDTLVRKAELAVGDCAYVYNREGQTIAKYVLDEEKAWRPAPVIEVVGVNSWTTTVGADVCTLVPGYGFWLKRGAASRPNKVYLWGYKWTGASPWTVSLVGSTETMRGKTLVSNPYGDAWDLNDATRVDWSATAAAGDWIQLNGGASAIYRYDGAKWVPYTFYTKDTKIPAGYGFWYIRAAGAGAATLTF